jgi:hypothetical protein
MTTTTTSVIQKRQLDYFYKKISEGHSNNDPTFSASSYSFELDTVNKIDGMMVKLIIYSSVFKHIQRREITLPVIHHTMSYRIEWKYCNRLLFDWNVSCIIKNPLEIKKNISKLLKQLNTNLSVMKINKYSGKLNCFEVFEGFGDQYLVDDICCICLDKTMTKTSCNHSICIECCNYMKTSCPNKDLTCPLCRNKFLLNDNDNNYDDDSSDDDSDIDDGNDYDGDENYDGEVDENVVINLVEDTIVNVVENTVIEDTVINVVEDTVINVVEDTVINVVEDTVINVVEDTVINVVEYI